MRRARLSYEGAILHGMNRGYNGQVIFVDALDKQIFIDLIAKAQGLTHVGVLAYCVMDNHYHLIVQDNSSRLADFFKQLNGQYASHYRKRHGGKGYVFQDRYKSSLIQDEGYVMLCLAYVLNNPIKAKLVGVYEEYPWSSADVYFSAEQPCWMDGVFFEEIFGDEQGLRQFVNANADLNELPMVKTPMGWMIGGDEFVPLALERSDRRSQQPSMQRKRMTDDAFEPVEKVLQEFERMNRVRLSELDTGCYIGKRLRSDLLVNLKERAGLRYRELAEMDLFSDLSINSLGAIYHRTRKKK